MDGGAIGAAIIEQGAGLPGWSWMPPNGALHGFAVDRLMRENLIALAVCFVLAQLLIAVALLRRRGSSTPRLWANAAAIEAVPLLALCGLYVWMAVTGQRLWAAARFEGPAPAAMQVEVVGMQFQWYFRYPGPDAAFGASRPELVDAPAGNPLGIDPRDPHGADDVVTSELVLPVGREVDVQLRSLDVIHGFFVPGMRLKQNAVPGLVLHVHFTPVSLGEYPILCSQVCGSGHARMQTRLRVVTPADFEEWLKLRTKP
jgi:cytochrome c oxidase subunit 2